jgi:hypothetical protein
LFEANDRARPSLLRLPWGHSSHWKPFLPQQRRQRIISYAEENLIGREVGAPNPTSIDSAWLRENADLVMLSHMRKLWHVQ